MTDLFRIDPSEGSEYVEFAGTGEAGYDAVIGFTEGVRTRAVGDPWVSPTVSIVSADDDDTRLLPVDVMYLFEPTLILNERAVRIVSRSLPEDEFELLPLDCASSESVVVFRATTSIEALDLDASEIDRFDSGRIMMIEEHVFDASRLGKQVVFTLTEDEDRTLIVTDAFVKATEELSGMEFRKIWGTED